MESPKPMKVEISLILMICLHRRMKSMRKVLLPLLAIPFILLGCNNNQGGGHKPAPTPEQYINVEVNQITLEVEETYQINTEILVENTIVFYSSNNKSVATVTEDGLVTAVAAGETSINIRGGKDYYSVFVTVTPYQAKDVIQITLTKRSYTLSVDDEFILPLQVKFGNDVISDYSISYLFENNNIVSISNLVMRALAVGTTKVVATATYNNQEANESFVVTVY